METTQMLSKGKRIEKLILEFYSTFQKSIESIKQLIVEKTLVSPINPSDPEYINPRKIEDRRRTCLEFIAKMTGENANELQTRYKAFREGEL